MPVDTWYDPAQHQRFDRVPDYKDVNPTDILGLFEAHQQRQRERAVKIAHKNYIEEKLQRCFMFYGVHSFKQHCRHLMEEFRQVKDELRGWKEDARVCHSHTHTHTLFNGLSISTNINHYDLYYMYWYIVYVKMFRDFYFVQRSSIVLCYIFPSLLTFA
jgi:hypothetical protein